MATAQKREEQPIEKKRPWGPVKEDLCRTWRETLDHMVVFHYWWPFGWSANSFKKSEKLPGCQYSMNFLSISVAFYSFIRSVDLWLIICFVLGLGYCPMSHVLCGVFLNVLALPLSVGTCGGVGMLGIALTAWSIKFPWLVFVVVVVVFFYLCSTYIFGLDMLLGEQGRVGRAGGFRVLGVNIVKCRNATT